MIERERKFLPNSDTAELARLLSHPSIERVKIEQGYVIASPEGEQLRIRRADESCYLTVKKGSGVEREEYESRITEELFDLLWPATEGARIEKTRYRVSFDQFYLDEALDAAGLEDERLTVEIDRFGRVHEGLYLIEVEFPTSESAEEFVPPGWFGREVSTDLRYTNSSLARSQSLP